MNTLELIRWKASIGVEAQIKEVQHTGKPHLTRRPVSLLLPKDVTALLDVVDVVERIANTANGFGIKVIYDALDAYYTDASVAELMRAMSDLAKAISPLIEEYDT